jgi:hypothetical protein
MQNSKEVSMDNKEDIAKLIIAFNPIATKIVDCVDKGFKAKTLKAMCVCATIFLSICVICFTVYLTLGFK